MAFDEDAYRDRQLNKYLDEQEQDEECSDCCGAETSYDVIDRVHICSECHEECEVTTIGEREYASYEDAMCDRADAQRELERELD